MCPPCNTPLEIEADFEVFPLPADYRPTKAEQVEQDIDFLAWPLTMQPCYHALLPQADRMSQLSDLGARPRVSTLTLRQLACPLASMRFFPAQATKITPKGKSKSPLDWKVHYHSKMPGPGSYTPTLEFCAPRTPGVTLNSKGMRSQEKLLKEKAFIPGPGEYNPQPMRQGAPKSSISMVLLNSPRASSDHSIRLYFAAENHLVARGGYQESRC